MNPTLTFPSSKPEEKGINSSWIVNFLNRIESQDLPLHSMILMRGDSIVAETYYAPYTKDTLHRMFSITKSFVSIAIGILESEGKLSLNDHITHYFPEKLSEKTIHPYLASLTIKDMLMMCTCHKSTTYKAPGCTDWVGSFFTTCPDHEPGTTFSYDTSSTHDLCALVQKLTGMTMLDFLRDRFLNEAGFSDEAYVVNAPGGEELGGSGLVAAPMDLLRFMYVISKGGVLNGRQVIPADYIKDATSKQVDTYVKSATWEEMQGYGYQFWRTTHNGYACYGMGGQYVIYYPDKDVILVTTADTQGRQGGTQLIYDAFYQEIYDKIGCDILNEDINPAYVGTRESSTYYSSITNRRLSFVCGTSTSSIKNKINEVRYNLDDNKNKIKWVSLNLNDFDGTFDFESHKGVFSIPFGIGFNENTVFPIYGHKAAISGAFKDENTFLIKAHIIDEAVGSVSIQLVFKDDKVTLFMKKCEETMYNEFDGFLCGKTAN